MVTSFSEIITDPMHETTCIKCKHLLDISGLPTFTQIACPECGTQQSVPGKLGSFVLVELLGKGGMGAVYRGHDVGLDRWVAIKVMQSSFGGNPEFVETFRREAQAAAALNHPNIVQIYSFGVAHGQPYLAMELLEGGRLDHMISTGVMLNESAILRIIIDVAEGLNAAAAISLIHGDVKPENILLDNNGVAKVVDFGLAQFKAKAEGGTAKGIWGTPYYIAPEKLKGHPADARSDIYSLGGTLFHALTLKPPFEGETPMDVVKARLKEPAPLLSKFRPDINPEIEGIVARMLEAEPQKRYPNYTSLLSDLRRVFSVLAPPVDPSPQAAKKSGKFVMIKKKGGALPVGMTMTASTSGALTHSGPLEPVASGRKSTHKRNVIIGSVVGVLALIGIIGGCYSHKVTQAQKTEEGKEKAALAKSLQGADLILKMLQPITGDFSNRIIMAEMWTSNAQQMVSMVASGATALADASEWVGASSNAAIVVEAVTQFLTGKMTSASAELKSDLEAVTAQRQVILSATNSAIAMAALSSITNIPGQVSDLHKSVSDDFGKIQKGGESMESSLKKFTKAMGRAAQDSAEAAKRDAIEKEAQNKLEAERLAAEKREAEKQAKIQADMADIGAGRKSCGVLIQQNKFAEALEIMEKSSKQLQTPEGKAKGKHVVKAYKMLVELKTTIIDGVKAEVKTNPDTGYRFGWMGTKDILKADDTKIETRDAKYSWDAVPVAQMMRFIKYFIEKGDLSRYEQAQHMFAVALYLHDAYGDNEKAVIQAAKYLKDAVRMTPSLGELAKAVLPDVSVN